MLVGICEHNQAVGIEGEGYRNLPSSPPIYSAKSGCFLKTIPLFFTAFLLWVPASLILNRLCPVHTIDV